MAEPTKSERVFDSVEAYSAKLADLLISGDDITADGLKTALGVEGVDTAKYVDGVQGLAKKLNASARYARAPKAKKAGYRDVVRLATYPIATEMAVEERDYQAKKGATEAGKPEEKKGKFGKWLKDFLNREV